MHLGSCIFPTSFITNMLIPLTCLEEFTTFCLCTNDSTSRMSLPVFPVKRSHSRCTTPTVKARTRPGAPARSRWPPCPFTLRYWSTTCRRSHPPHADLRARPRPLHCPERGRGSGRGRERGSDLHTAKERKATGERGVRGNWCS